MKGISDCHELNSVSVLTSNRHMQDTVGYLRRHKKGILLLHNSPTKDILWELTTLHAPAPPPPPQGGLPLGMEMFTISQLSYK